MNGILMVNKTATLLYQPFNKMNSYSAIFSCILLMCTLMALLFTGLLLPITFVAKSPFILVSMLLLQGMRLSAINEQ